MMDAAEAVVRVVREMRNATSSRVLMVALDGRSGAGKSTIATAVAAVLDGAVVHVDDFYRDMSDVERLKLSPRQGVDRYFDWQRLREEALAPLARGEPARFGCFDWFAGRGLTATTRVEPREIVFVEGIYSARPEFDDLLDLRVLVEVAEEARNQRREQRLRTVSRDDPQGWDARWDAAERVYFATIRPPDTFDLTVSGNE
jgi:uridine kinase